MVYRDDDRGRGLEVRRHVDVHAQFCGHGIEVVDFGDRLAVAEGQESGEDGNGR